MVATLLADYNNSETARRYAEESTDSASSETISQVKRDAEEYNAGLWAAGHPVRREDPDDPRYQGYKKQLLASEHSSTMARIQIPDVAIDLPVYHGTSDDVPGSRAPVQLGSSYRWRQPYLGYYRAYGDGQCEYVR